MSAIFEDLLTLTEERAEHIQKYHVYIRIPILASPALSFWDYLD